MTMYCMICFHGDLFDGDHFNKSIFVCFLSSEMNAKGVILNAFERYRLKTCIDFKPWTGETNYISVFKGSGYIEEFVLLEF